MNYTTEIEISLPLLEMVSLLDDPENMKHWQRGLLAFKLISGDPGQQGAQMELHYEMGKRKVVMIETIIKRNLPDEFHATYDAKGVHNIQKNYFEPLGENRCRWVSESEFQFSGFPMKLIGWFMPGAFKKQSRATLKDFKTFAETGKSVSKS